MVAYAYCWTWACKKTTYEVTTWVSFHKANGLTIVVLTLRKWFNTLKFVNHISDIMQSSCRRYTVVRLICYTLIDGDRCDLFSAALITTGSILWITISPYSASLQLSMVCGGQRVALSVGRCHHQENVFAWYSQDTSSYFRLSSKMNKELVQYSGCRCRRRYRCSVMHWLVQVLAPRLSPEWQGGVIGVCCLCC